MAVRCTEAFGKCGLANSSRRYGTMIREGGEHRKRQAGGYMRHASRVPYALRPGSICVLNCLRRYATLGVPYVWQARSFILQFQGHGHLITTEARLFPIIYRLARHRVFPYISVPYRLLSRMHKVFSKPGPLEDDAVLLRSSE